jgi:hypothetical protein
MSDTADTPVLVPFVFHEKEVQLIDVTNDFRVVKSVHLQHSVLTGKVVGSIMATVGTAPESVCFVDLLSEVVSCHPLKVKLGCLSSVDIHPATSRAAVVTTAGLPELPLLLAHVSDRRSVHLQTCSQHDHLDQFQQRQGAQWSLQGQHVCRSFRHMR